MISIDDKEPSFPVPPAFPEADVCLHHPHTLQEMALPTLTSSIMLVPFEHGGAGLQFPGRGYVWEDWLPRDWCERKIQAGTSSRVFPGVCCTVVLRRSKLPLPSSSCFGERVGKQLAGMRT